MQEIQNTKNTENNNNNKKQRRNLDSVAFRPRVIMTVKVTEIETVLTAVSNIESKFNFIKKLPVHVKFLSKLLAQFAYSFPSTYNIRSIQFQTSRSVPDLLGQ